MSKRTRYSPEVSERAVRMVLEHQSEYESQWATMESIAQKIGCTAETLRKWVRQAERDQGLRPGLTTDERERLKALERENKGLRRANEILKTASAFFRPGGARPQTQEMITYIDDHKDRYGVEPICKVLPIAPSTYYEHKAREQDPDRRIDRAKRDDMLKPEIERIWLENLRVYGARKVWLQLNREAIEVARGRHRGGVDSLGRELGLWRYRGGGRVRHGLVDEAGVDIVHGHSSHHAKGIEVYNRRLVLYGCGDLVNDYEGIRGSLGLMYFPRIDLASGHLLELRMQPVQMRRMRLCLAEAADAEWLAATLTEHSRRFAAGISVAADGAGLLRADLGTKKA